MQEELDYQLIYGDLFQVLLLPNVVAGEEQNYPRIRILRK